MENDENAERKKMKIDEKWWKTTKNRSKRMKSMKKDEIDEKGIKMDEKWWKTTKNDEKGW